MALTEHGKVHDGSIVFAHPLELPEGTEVVVHIEPITIIAGPTNQEEFATLPFFGMWSDREDMQDSSAYIKRAREQWQ